MHPNINRNNKCVQSEGAEDLIYDVTSWCRHVFYLLRPLGVASHQIAVLLDEALQLAVVIFHARVHVSARVLHLLDVRLQRATHK